MNSIPIPELCLRALSNPISQTKLICPETGNDLIHSSMLCTKMNGVRGLVKNSLRLGRHVYKKVPPNTKRDNPFGKRKEGQSAGYRWLLWFLNGEPKTAMVVALSKRKRVNSGSQQSSTY